MTTILFFSFKQVLGHMTRWILVYSIKDVIYKVAAGNRLGPLLLVIVYIHALYIRFFLVAFVELWHVFLRLQMAIKVEQALTYVTYNLHLLEQDSIESLYVHLNITAWLINLVQKLHLFLHDSDDFIDMCSMWMNQLLFFLEDFLYELLMVIAQIVHITSIMLLKLDLCLYPWFKLVYLDGMHRILGRPSLNRPIAKLFVMVCKHRYIIARGSLWADGLETRLLKVIRVTTTGEHLGCCLRSCCLRIPWRDQSCGSLLRLITILITEAIWLLLLRLFLAAILDSLNLATQARAWSILRARIWLEQIARSCVDSSWDSIAKLVRWFYSKARLRLLLLLWCCLW